MGRWLARTLALGFMLGWSATVHAQDYPSRPIRIVAPFPAGGAADILARAIAQKFTEAWGQPAVVDNRPGAGGTIGADVVAKAPPDGYTLLLGSTATQSIAPGIYPKLAYNPLTDFVAVATVAQVPVVLVVGKAVPARSVQELIALAKTKPDELTFASSGSGAIPHLTGELFKSSAGVKMVHVPYRGATPALADLLSGQVGLMFDNLPSSLPHIQAGTLTALGVATPTRAASLPTVPTIAEAGLPGFAVVSWFGIMAPAGTPEPVLAKLRAEIGRALAAADVQAHLAQQGAEPFVLAPAAFEALIKTDAAKWAAVVKANDVKID
ncbi:MAG: tripartite tricarboxylate transporter substrate binding protein [Alphaproteobacteria bacterium]|nr:tripartite tricarboxylate transporter substrate binding protein [Alphaproteobacteria bacterium]